MRAQSGGAPAAAAARTRRAGGPGWRTGPPSGVRQQPPDGVPGTRRWRRPRRTQALGAQPVGPGVVERRQVAPRRSPSAAAGRPGPGCGPAPGRASRCRACLPRHAPSVAPSLPMPVGHPGQRRDARAEVGAAAVVLEAGQRRQAQRGSISPASSPTARVGPRSECRSSRSRPGALGALGEERAAEQLVAGADGEHHRAPVDRPVQAAVGDRAAGRPAPAGRPRRRRAGRCRRSRAARWSERTSTVSTGHAAQLRPGAPGSACCPGRRRWTAGRGRPRRSAGSSVDTVQLRSDVLERGVVGDHLQPAGRHRGDAPRRTT